MTRRTNAERAHRAALERHRWLERQRLGCRLLGGHCVVCGTKRRLEFDHIDPRRKSFHLMGGTVSIDRWLAELKKCQLLCKKHHKIKSDWEELQMRKHGTWGAYKAGCRCDQCVVWYATHRTRARK